MGLPCYKPLKKLIVPVVCWFLDKNQQELS